MCHLFSISLGLSGHSLLNRIERGLKKLREWLLLMMYADKENCEKYLFQESYDLIDRQIDMNLEIDEARVDHAHSVDISPRVRQLKKKFNFVQHIYRELLKEFNDP